MNKTLKLSAAVLLMIAAPFAEAHTGLAGVAQNGFLSGLSHPLLGADHLLAMLAVGVWAGMTGGKARWQLPLLFIAFIVLAAVVSMGMTGMPLVENGIAVSLLLSGLFIVFAVQLPAFSGMLIISLFAVLHGYAHGAEWPAATSPVAYAAGFVLASTALLAASVLTANACTGKRDLFLRYTGILFAAAGGWMLLMN